MEEQMTEETLQTYLDSITSEISSAHEAIWVLEAVSNGSLDELADLSQQILDLEIEVEQLKKKNKNSGLDDIHKMVDHQSEKGTAAESTIYLQSVQTKAAEINKMTMQLNEDLDEMERVNINDFRPISEIAESLSCSAYDAAQLDELLQDVTQAKEEEKKERTKLLKIEASKSYAANSYSDMNEYLEHQDIEAFISPNHEGLEEEESHEVQQMALFTTLFEDMVSVWDKASQSVRITLGDSIKCRIACYLLRGSDIITDIEINSEDICLVKELFLGEKITHFLTEANETGVHTLRCHYVAGDIQRMSEQWGRVEQRITETQAARQTHGVDLDPETGHIVVLVENTKHHSPCSLRFSILSTGELVRVQRTGNSTDTVFEVVETYLDDDSLQDILQNYSPLSL